jgi:hypothetical protein
MWTLPGAFIVIENGNVEDWIDRFLWIALFSASSRTYREMGLANIAFVLLPAGRWGKVTCLLRANLRERVFLGGILRRGFPGACQS